MSTGFELNKENETLWYMTITSVRIDHNKYDIPHHIKSRFCWVLVLAFITLMTLTDPTQIVARTSGLVGAIFWTILAVLYITLISTALYVLPIILAPLTIKMIFLPLISIVIMYILVNFGYSLDVFLSQYEFVWPYPLASEIWIYFAIEQVFLTLYMTLSHPLVSNELNEAGNIMEDSVKFSAEISLNSDASEQKSTNNRVQINKKDYLIADIISIIAEEHYVKIIQRSTCSLERARLRNVTQLLPETHGIQIHRSTWVSKLYISHAIFSEGQLTTVMQNETAYPVARARKNTTLHWLKSNDIEISPLPK